MARNDGHMLDEPETQYLEVRRDVHLAYQVFGHGVPVVFVPGWYSHLELMWEEPTMSGFLRRLGTFARVAMFDTVGSGLSDHAKNTTQRLVDRVEEVLAVADRAGFGEFAMIAATMAGPLAVRVHNHAPEQVHSLVLFNTAACHVRRPGYDIAAPRDVVERSAAMRAEDWGRRIAPMSRLTPDQARLERWLPRYQRFSLSPGIAEELYREALSWDVVDELRDVRARTLVLHRRDNPGIRADHGLYLADHIPGARYIALPGTDALWNLDPAEPVLDEIEAFLTPGEPKRSSDRALLSLVFTDVVGSTGHAASAGDRRWLQLLEVHDRVIGELVGHHGGRTVNTTGDGALASFDRPGTAVECALRIVQRTRALGLDVRVGVHAGECDLREGDIGGLTVHIASRIMSLAQSEVLVSQTIHDLMIGSDVQFEPAGSHELRGVPGQWQLYRVHAEATTLPLDGSLRRDGVPGDDDGSGST